MVEAEEEYVDQLEILISCFLRPFKMAASSKNPPCTHEDINSIFLNSETVLFLHQIFLKGLTARMESWPTLVLGTSLGGESGKSLVGAAVDSPVIVYILHKISKSAMMLLLYLDLHLPLYPMTFIIFRWTANGFVNILLKSELKNYKQKVFNCC